MAELSDACFDLGVLANLGQGATEALANLALPATKNLQVADSIDPSNIGIPLSAFGAAAELST